MLSAPACPFLSLARTPALWLTSPGPQTAWTSAEPPARGVGNTVAIQWQHSGLDLAGPWMWGVYEGVNDELMIPPSTRFCVSLKSTQKGTVDE